VTELCVFQPALYEAFGLTVIEAMNCGLPTFATNQGGPAEIIVDEVSGFHINPLNGQEASDKIAGFFQKCKEDPIYWNKMSTAGLQRIYEWYNYTRLSLEPIFIQSNALMDTTCFLFTD
jgi:sucrose synthase